MRRALEDTDGRWFVAAVFATQPIPAALREPMLRAALQEPVDASGVQWFIKPLAETFGVEDTYGRLKALAQANPPIAVAGRLAQGPIQLRHRRHSERRAGTGHVNAKFGR